MTVQNELAQAALTHEGAVAAAIGDAEIDTLRRRALYRATLTADLLERGEAGGMAAWDCDVQIWVEPDLDGRPLMPGMAYVFETPAAAARFVRREIVPRLMDGAFDAALAAGRGAVSGHVAAVADDAAGAFKRAA
jgi:hypothetical protein